MEKETEKLIDELYNNRKAGTEYSALRKQLEAKNLDSDEIKFILNAVNERELQELKIPNNSLNPVIFLVLSLLTLGSGLFLSYFLQKINSPSSYYLLNAIPLIGAAILYYHYNQNRKTNKR